MSNLSKLLVHGIWGYRGWGVGELGNVMCKSLFPLIADLKLSEGS